VCGGGDKGQLGLGPMVSVQTIPVPITMPRASSRCISISAGLFHNTAVCLAPNEGFEATPSEQVCVFIYIRGFHCAID
jgi:hypothetical protein